MNILKIDGRMEGGGQAGREKDGESNYNIQDARVSEKQQREAIYVSLIMLPIVLVLISQFLFALLISISNIAMGNRTWVPYQPLGYSQCCKRWKP